MADLYQLKTALHAFATAALPTGMPVSWQGDVHGLELKLPAKCWMQITAIEEVGIDFWSPSESTPGDGAVQNYRHASCFFRIISRAHPGNYQAEYFLERIRGALRHPVHREILRAVPIGVIGCGPTASYPASLDNREESIAAMELQFAFKFTDAALETTDGDYFDTISGEYVRTPPGAPAIPFEVPDVP